MVAARHWLGGGLPGHWWGMSYSCRTPDERLLARYAESRDPADLEELVRRYRPLARSLARRFRNPAVASEDLGQAACLGLVGALLRFDPARGYAFSTFAVPTILGELRRLRYADERTYREIGRELALGPAQAARLLRNSVDRLAALAA
jgi:DNA-directed RNA polymerase specialized sigma subunit